jgi:hypothetical protein
MSTLLLEKNLRSSEEDSEVRTLARARTLTVLRRLDGKRKGSVLKFLSESRLIDEEDPVLYLAGTDLLGASLIGGELRRAYLSGAYLSGAYLIGAHLIGTNLSEAIGWTVEQLSQARSLEGATMPDGQKYEDWLKSKDGGEDGENPES